MQVVLAVGWDVIVNDERDLLHVNTTCKQIGGDQDTRRTTTELLHDLITLGLVHVTMHGRHGKLTVLHRVTEVLDFPLGVAEDDALGDGHCLVEITEHVHLPGLLLDVNVELLDTLEGELGTLDKNVDWVAHELCGDLKHVLWHGGGEKHNLDLLWKKLEHVVDLLLETEGKHLIGLIEHKQLDGLWVEVTRLNEMVHTTWGTDNDLGAILQGTDVIDDWTTTNAVHDVDLEVVAESKHDALDLLGQLTGWGHDKSLHLAQVRVDGLKHRDGEGGGLTGTRLRLGDHIATLEAWLDGTLLDGRWALETVSVDTAEKVVLQAEVVKGLHNLVPVGLDFAFDLHAGDALNFSRCHVCS
eukprot:m.351640 g.351640  ORF g.351640 m.351640 type:complete len:356 (+) comp16299_c0_seq1:1899-2966(+)